MAGTRSIGTLAAIISGNADLLAKELQRANTLIDNSAKATQAGFKGIESGASKMAIGLLGAQTAARLVSGEIRAVIKDIENIPGVPGDTVASIQRMRGEFTLAQNQMQFGAASTAGLLSDAATSIGAFWAELIHNPFDLAHGMEGMDVGLRALNDDMEKATRLAPAYQQQLKEVSAQLHELQLKSNEASLTPGARINQLGHDSAGLRADAAHFDSDDITNNLMKQIAAVQKDVEAKGIQRDIDKQLADAERSLAAAQTGANVATLSRADAIDALKERIGALQVELYGLSGAYKLTKNPELEEKIIAKTKEETQAQTQLNGLLRANSEWADRLGDAFQGTFQTALRGGENLGGFLRSLEQDIAGVFGQLAVVNPAINAIFGRVDGFKSLPAISGGGILEGIGKLFGFASGGDFTVAGSGGTDSQVVAFKASPGEKVSVRTPGDSSGGGDTLVFAPQIAAGVTRQELAGMMPGMFTKFAAMVDERDRRRR